MEVEETLLAKLTSSSQPVPILDLTSLGATVSEKELNSLLYSLQERGLVERTADNPPLWSATVAAISNSNEEQQDSVMQDDPPATEEEPQHQCMGEDEREHLENVCNSFRQYATFMRCGRMGRMQRIQSFTTPEQKQVLPKWMLSSDEGDTYSKRQTVLQDAELRNQFFLDCMLRHAGMKHSQDFVSENNGESAGGTSSTTGGYVGGNSIPWASQETMDKVHAVLRSVARDWSKEGAAERANSYAIILDSLKRYLPLNPNTDNIVPTTAATIPNHQQQNPPRVLVPGLGLARLALEIYSLGYEVQGNEFSLHMLLASDFILNACTADIPFVISPYLDTTKNVCRNDDPVRRLYIPDIDPNAAMQGHIAAATTTNTPDDNYYPNEPDLPDFSVAAGEFASIYSKPDHHNQWDAVASCFFLDTAPNIIQYIQVIYNLLAPNGLFINFGPLHYHWSGPPLRPDDTSFEKYTQNYTHLDDRYLQSIELSWEDLREVLHNVGFELLEERLGLRSRYTADTRSFMSTDYRCVYFVARKKIVASEES